MLPAVQLDKEAHVVYAAPAAAQLLVAVAVAVAVAASGARRVAVCLGQLEHGPGPERRRGAPAAAVLPAGDAGGREALAGAEGDARLLRHVLRVAVGGAAGDLGRPAALVGPVPREVVRDGQQGVVAHAHAHAQGTCGPEGCRQEGSCQLVQQHRKEDIRLGVRGSLVTGWRKESRSLGRRGLVDCGLMPISLREAFFYV